MADDKKYLLKLLNLAEKPNSFHKSISIFYRNKNAEYFDKAERNGNVLPTLKKDNGGDGRSPINGRLRGVFLDTTLRNGQLPNKSPFGDYRIQFPIAALFDKTTNLYFTDFYCKKTSYHHYVTLVIAKRGSEADTFCKEKLVRLNPKTNPFLRRNEESGGEPTFTTNAEDSGNSRLHVEVFYTEEIRIEELKKKFGDRVNKTKTGSFSKGRSTRNGLPKDPDCDVCNPRNWFSKVSTPSYVMSAEEEVELDRTADEVKSNQTNSNESNSEEVTCKTSAVEKALSDGTTIPLGDLTNETPPETERESSPGGKTEPEVKVKLDQPEKIVGIENSAESEQAEKMKEKLESEESDGNAGTKPLVEKVEIKQPEENTEREEEKSKVELNQPDMKIAMEGPEAKVEREQSEVNIEPEENGKYVSTVSPGIREIIGEPKVMIDAQDDQVKEASELLEDQVCSPEVLDTEPQLEVRNQKRKHESSSPCDELPPKRSLIDENSGNVIEK